MTDFTADSSARHSAWTSFNRFRKNHPNVLTFLIALIIYAIVSWGILAAHGIADIRFRFDPSELVASPLVLKLHIMGAVITFAIGIVLMLGLKGRALHKRLGYTWVATMGLTAVTSFFLTGLNGGQFSFIHGISAWVVIGLPFGVAAARRHDIRRHSRHMTGLFTGGMLIAGLFSFLPGRMLWSIFFAA